MHECFNIARKFEIYARIYFWKRLEVIIDTIIDINKLDSDITLVRKMNLN